MWPTLCQTCDGVPSAFPDCTLPGNLFVRPHTALFDAFQLSRAPHAAPAAPVAHTHTATTPQPDVTPSTLAVLDSMRTDPELIQGHPGTTPLMLIHDGGGTVLACRLCSACTRPGSTRARASLASTTSQTSMPPSPGKSPHSTPPTCTFSWAADPSAVHRPRRCTP